MKHSNDTTHWPWIPLLVGAIMFAAHSAQAGTVETAAGRFEGPVSFQSNAVKVGDKQVALGDVLFLYGEPTAKAEPPKQLIRLQNGEMWVGEIVKGTSKKVEVTNGWFGTKAFDLNHVSVLDFMPSEPVSTVTKPKTLCRKQGQPLPGAIVWIDKDTLGVDSPLGTVTIRRQGLIRYVMSNKAPARTVGAPDAGSMDEIGLVDGNVFRGRLEMKDGEVILNHPVGGRATFPIKVVCYIVRHTADMLELSELPHEVIKTSDDPLAKGKQLAASDFARAKNLAAGFVRATRFEPRITVRYTLPERKGNKLTLRTTLASIPAARGDARIKFSVGEKTVVDQVLSQADATKAIDVTLPEGKELVIDVDFGPLLRFPCGVMLQDAHLVLVK